MMKKKESDPFRIVFETLSFHVDLGVGQGDSRPAVPLGACGMEQAGLTAINSAFSCAQTLPLPNKR